MLIPAHRSECMAEHPIRLPRFCATMQGHLLMVAMQLMLGGSLRAALINPACQDALRWNNW